MDSRPLRVSPTSAGPKKSCNDFICRLTPPNLLESLLQCEMSSKQEHDWKGQFYPALIRTPAILHLDTTFQVFATSCPVRDRFDFTHILLVSPPRLFLQALLLHTCSVSLAKAWLLEIRWRSDPIKQNHRYFMQRSTRSDDPSSVQLNRTCLYYNNTTKHILNI